MLWPNNYSGKIFFLSLALIITILSAELQYSVLPFTGAFLLLYLITVLSLTVWLTWVCFQNLLRQSKPFTYDFDGNYYLKLTGRVYRYLRSLRPRLLKQDIHGKNGNHQHEVNAGFASKPGGNIDERIDDFVKDVENHFVLKWYPHISNDATFLTETRSLLDEVTRRFLQIVVHVDNKKLVHGVLMILLKHVKEFRKTAKRQQRVGGCVEDVYRYAHVGSKNAKAFDHFAHQVTTRIFRQFINWELYNSVPCRCLVAILAKKLTIYALTYVSNPAFVNYKAAQTCACEATKASLELHKYDAISLSDVDLSVSVDTSGPNEPRQEVKSSVSRLDCGGCSGSTPKISPKRNDLVKSAVDAAEKNLDEAFTTTTTTDSNNESASAQAKRRPPSPPATIDHHDEERELVARPVSEPVKIYESRSRGGETWRNSSDLECISLGQDLLQLQDIDDANLQIQDLIEEKLWKDNFDSLEADERGYATVGETKDVQGGGTPSPNLPSFLNNTIKPTIGNVTANMKELQQSAVNNIGKPVSQATTSAIHKIGDLQDEAAGMMEGILDFGRAGIRRGLRLTGLHDNLADKHKAELLKRDAKAPKHPQKAGKLVKTPHVSSDEAKADRSLEDTIWLNPLVKDSPNFDGQLLLEKSPVVSPHPFGSSSTGVVPSIAMDNTSTSPDLEYEDTTDLATTTAKLRFLLQQRSSESNLTTPALSPMPTEEAARTPAAGSVEDMIEVDGALPTLYKFCARTATGVFHNTLNTIKTALPGNAGDQDDPGELFNHQSSVDNWTFVASDVGPDDLPVHVERLLNERRVFCTVDNAYEAVETLDVLDHDDVVWNTTPTRNYYDELDDFDVHVPITKTLVDVFCELVGDTDTLFVQESVVKMFLIHLGGLIEEHIDQTSAKMIRNVNSLLGKFPANTDGQPLAMSLEGLCSVLLEAVPDSVKAVVGRENLRSAATFLATCFQSHRINLDVALQLLELAASLIIDASGKMSPTYSA